MSWNINTVTNSYLSILVLRFSIIIVSVHWWISANPLWGTVGTISFLLTYIPSLVLRRTEARLAVILCISALLATHLIAGMALGFYEHSVVYDKLMHGINSAVITLLILFLVFGYSSEHTQELPTVIIISLVMGTAITAGTLWEIFEFLVDRTGLFLAQRGLIDTMLDLVANTLGTLAVLCSYFLVKNSEKLPLLARSFMNPRRARPNN